MMNRKRNAIAMIMAIGVIVIIGTIMALSMALTLKTGKRTVETYLYEQVEILSDSAREYAIYKIKVPDNNCSNKDYPTFLQKELYNIDISVQCITKADDVDLIHESAIIDVVVSIDKSKTNTAEDIRFHKRYIENIKP